MINVTQHSQISRVRPDLAQYAGTVALAVTHSPANLPLMLIQLCSSLIDALLLLILSFKRSVAQISHTVQEICRTGDSGLTACQ